MNTIICMTLISVIGAITLSIELKKGKARMAEARIAEKNYLCDKEEI